MLHFFYIDCQQICTKVHFVSKSTWTNQIKIKSSIHVNFLLNIMLIISGTITPLHISNCYWLWPHHTNFIFERLFFKMFSQIVKLLTIRSTESELRTMFVSVSTLRLRSALSLCRLRLSLALARAFSSGGCSSSRAFFRCAAAWAIMPNRCRISNVTLTTGGTIPCSLSHS